jgi:hypothetical protein
MFYASEIVAIVVLRCCASRKKISHRAAKAVIYTQGRYLNKTIFCWHLESH